MSAILILSEAKSSGLAAVIMFVSLYLRKVPTLPFLSITNSHLAINNNNNNNKKKKKNVHEESAYQDQIAKKVLCDL